jgi:predicted patatin/cPLA2 family phospholipase
MNVAFRKLGLGGGGMKGILHVGALRELSKYQPLVFPDGIYGVSIGSIAATYLSFNLPMDESFVTLSRKYLSMDRVTPKLTFHDITNVLSSKGMFSMDLFESALIEMFNEVGINLKGKTIGDAHQPLYIVASNITKGVPTIFTKDVPILDALKCSCCIPGVFKPQILYNQIYVDGGVFVPCISWIQPDALVLSLTKTKTRKLHPSEIAETSPVVYLRDIYSMAVNNFIQMHKNETSVSLSYPNLMSDSDLESFDVDDILAKSGNDLRSFLIAKGFLQEVPEVGSSGSTSHLI